MAKKRSDSDIFEKNLTSLDRETARRLEKRICLFAEASHSAAEQLMTAAQEGPPRKELLESIAPALFENALHENALPDNRRLLQTALSSLSALDRVSFINALLEHLAAAGAPLTIKELIPSAGEPEPRVAYFRNPYTDEAYEIFSEELSFPKVQYTDSFRASCEAVRTGAAGFCILPVANTEGELFSFTDMADSHGLVRVALCRVFHADGTDVTHFALYARSFFFPLSEGEKRTLRFSLTLRGAEEIACTVSALSLLGAEMLSFSGTDGEDGEHTVFSAVCRILPAECLSLSAYLTVFSDGWRFLGLYRELS